MYKILYNILSIAAFAVAFSACSTDEVDTNNSIFVNDKTEKTEFDKWLLNNFTYPYNVEVKYRLEDIETNNSYTVTPADSTKAAKIAKLVKYLWFDAYDEAIDNEFLKNYAPRQLMLVGSGMYNSNNTVILGYATGSIKIVLTNVNELTEETLKNADELDRLYFSTFHHEFEHILNQKVAYDRSYEEISRPDYVSGNWYQENNEDAYRKGFVRNYAMQEASEDIAETYADYVSYSPKRWNNIMTTAAQCKTCHGDAAKKASCATCGGTGKGDGAQKIMDKIYRIRTYLKTSFSFDIDKLREVVQRRNAELSTIDLDNL
mgnify:FL=1